MISTCGVLMRWMGSLAVMKMKSSDSIVSKGNLRRSSSPISRKIIGGKSRAGGNGKTGDQYPVVIRQVPDDLMKYFCENATDIIIGTGLLFYHESHFPERSDDSLLQTINLCMQGSGSNYQEFLSSLQVVPRLNDAEGNTFSIYLINLQTDPL